MISAYNDDLLVVYGHSNYNALHSIVMIILKSTISNKMKTSDSLLTCVTKDNTLKISPQKRKINDRIATVFIPHSTHLFSVKLLMNQTTIREFISKALQKLKTEHDIHLNSNCQSWALYPSKKNGKRCNDYPSLEPNQRVELTGLSCFYLKPVDQSVSDIVWSGKIVSEFAPKKQSQIKTKEVKSCLCLFNL